MTGMLSDLEAPISEMLEMFFDEPQLTATITYRLYQGQGPQAEDAFLDFQILCIPSRKKSDEGKLARLLKIGKTERHYIIREKDLPEGLNVAILSTNDRIVHGNDILRVVEIDKTLGFVIEVHAGGE